MRRRGSRDGRWQSFIWIPRGPAGIALFVVLLALVLALVVAASAILLVAAVAVGATLAVAQVGRGLLFGGVGRQGSRAEVRLPQIDGRFLDHDTPALERYISLVEQFDQLCWTALSLDLANSAAWRSGRKVSKTLGRAVALREHVLAVERQLALDADAGAEAARPGLWELAVAATELVRFLQAVAEYPSTRGRSAQMRELSGLLERRTEIDGRREALIRRLQQTDLRPPRAVGS